VNYLPQSNDLEPEYCASCMMFECLLVKMMVLPMKFWKRSKTKNQGNKEIEKKSKILIKSPTQNSFKIIIMKKKIYNT
jgi:hypothetical protein